MTETAYTRLSRVPEPLERELREVAEESGAGLKAVVEAVLAPRITREAVVAGQRRLAELDLAAGEVDLGVHLPRVMHDQLRELATAARVSRGDITTLILAGCAGRIREEVGAALAPATAGAD